MSAVADNNNKHGSACIIYKVQNSRKNKIN